MEPKFAEMPPQTTNGAKRSQDTDAGLADFSTDRRVLLLSAMAVVVGAISSFMADAGSTDVAVTFPDEPLHAALTTMLSRDVGRLPVVDRSNPTRVIGYFGRAAILSARMRLHEEENIRQRR